MHDFVDFSEIALANDVTDLILELEVLKDSEVLEELKPLFYGGLPLGHGLVAHQVDTGSCQDDGLVHISNDYALLDI